MDGPAFRRCHLAGLLSQDRPSRAADSVPVERTSDHPQRFITVHFLQFSHASPEALNVHQDLFRSDTGLAIGLSAALATSKFVESFLYGMKPNDPQALAGAAVALLAAALVAGYWPARKASRIDPNVALRHE